MVIKIINECNALFELEHLIIQIKKISKRDNARIRESYRIFLVNKDAYPMLSIGHKKYRLHNIIMENKKGFHIHHINENTLDNRLKNLKYVTPKEHLYEHRIWEKIDKDKLKNNRLKALEKIKRKDITKEVIESLRKKGLSLKEISIILNCGYNTVLRRLDYKI